jgi:carbonic anhydrase
MNPCRKKGCSDSPAALSALCSDVPEHRVPASPQEPSDLLARNQDWAAGITRHDPTFFERLVAQQSPKYLWIGCSDSRVPANEIVGLAPGEMFVHRNVANLVVHTDLNCLAVLQYAVDVLGVEHVIVCGHYGCGGIRAALENGRLGLIDNWLRHVQDVALIHSRSLEQLDSMTERWDYLCERNVEAQVEAVIRTTIVQDAWERDQRLSVHGWIYRLQDGILRELTVAQDGRGRG